MKIILTLFYFGLFTYTTIGKANSLRDSRESFFQQTLSQYNAKFHSFHANDDGVMWNFPAGQSTDIVRALRITTVARWQSIEPLDYKTINLLYSPFCLQSIEFTDIKKLNLPARIDTLANEIEASFQTFGTYETPTFASLVESASVLRNNLNVLNNSISLIPAVNEQISNLLTYVAKVETTHLHFLNLISTNLANSGNISDAINSLNVLQSTIIDATEKEILNQVITLMTTLSKLPNEIYDGIKNNQLSPGLLAITSQISYYEIMVTKWQSSIQASYNETIISLSKIDADIAATRAIMSQATDTVDRDIAAIKNIELEAESTAISNFQKIDERINRIIESWHQEIVENSGSRISLRNYVRKWNLITSYRHSRHKGRGIYEERRWCVDESE